MHKAVITILESHFKGLKVYFEPLGGNNGDVLIEMGSKEVLKNTGINLVPDPAQAEAIVINGSGDLSYHSPDLPIENTRQAKMLLHDLSKPVLLLSSSCTEGNAKNLQTVLSKRQAKTFLVARDAISFAFLKKYAPETTDVQIDHDMAFALANSRFITDLLNMPQSNNLLIVERFDAEGATRPPAIYRAGKLRALIPNGLKDWLKRMLLGRIHASTPFVTEVKAKVKSAFPDIAYKDVLAADVSLPQNYTLEEFTQSVAKASVVVSTRLHVCILAYLLDKPFIAVQFEGGNKLKGVYEYSLASAEKGHLWIKAK